MAPRETDGAPDEPDDPDGVTVSLKRFFRLFPAADEDPSIQVSEPGGSED